MTLLWGVIGYVIYLYILLMLARICLEMTRQFARSWRPAGTAAIGVELVYVVTDPPIRLLRQIGPAAPAGYCEPRLERHHRADRAHRAAAGCAELELARIPKIVSCARRTA